MWSAWTSTVGTCGQRSKAFGLPDLVAESTPLIEILSILRDRQRAFLLTSNRVDHIVTRGDLQKTPVRMFLFGLISLLEMQLLRVILAHYPGERWRDYLDPKRVRKARRLQSLREKRNEALGLVDCLMLLDKLTVIRTNPELREQMDLNDRPDGQGTLEAIEGLRNRVAHANDLILGTSWPAVVDLVKQIDKLLRQAERIE